MRVAAYAGLRRGELVALRWHDVDFARRKLVVRRAVSGGVEASSTKSRRAREVPLPDQAAGALDRLSQRGDFTHPDDYVFTNRLGRRLDGSALRRRVERAREAAGLRPLRFSRPAPHLWVAAGRRRDRPGLGQGGDGPFAYHHNRALFARTVRQRARRQVHARARDRRGRDHHRQRHVTAGLGEARDPDGRRVILDERTADHLRRRRPQMLHHLGAILDAVARPDVREDDPVAHRERFYRQDLDRRRWLRVVVDFGEETGFVVTAFIQDHEPGSTQ